jgi:hypothetical protein
MTPIQAAALFFAPSVVLAVAGTIGCGLSFWRQNKRRTILAAFQKAHQRYQDARGRGDTRAMGEALDPLKSAMTARLRADVEASR